MTRALIISFVVVAACGAPPTPEVVRACRALAQRPTIELIATSSQWRHVVSVSEVIEGMTPGGVPGASVSDGWQLQAATRQQLVGPGDPIVRSRTFARAAAGRVEVLFENALQRLPSSVDADLTFDFADTAGRVTQWRVAALGLAVEACE